MKKHKYDFINIPDAKSFTDSLNMNSFPVNVFLDKNGAVIRIENGIPYVIENGELKMGDEKAFEEILRKLL